MNIVKCPNCESFDFDVYLTKGSIIDGRIIEETECLDCGETFAVIAEISNIRIEIGVKNGNSRTKISK